MAYQLRELAAVLNLTVPNDQLITSFTTDSRKVAPGALFVAVKGERQDGHDFLREVTAKGAACAIVKKSFSAPDIHLPLLRVDDSLAALQTVAAHVVKRSRAKVVAITGSLGKSSTKEFIYQLLKSKWKTMSTTGNQNSQVGLSLSLLNNIKGDEEYLVLEMGMTHPGQIERLVQIAPPDIALITYITYVHAANFDSMEGIARAKSEILLHPHTSVGILNADMPCLDICLNSGSSRKVTYSLKMLDEKKKGILQNVQVPAPHIHLNMLAACTVAAECGMSWEEIGEVLPTLSLPEKRLQIVEKKGITFVNDAYNAAEESIKAALGAVRDRPCKGRKIAVLGGIRELGRFSQVCHENVGISALSSVERLYCLGEECEPIVRIWKEAKRPVSWFIEFDLLLKALQAELRPDDLVLLKGSNSYALWRVLEQL